MSTNKIYSSDSALNCFDIRSQASHHFNKTKLKQRVREKDSKGDEDMDEMTGKSIKCDTAVQCESVREEGK